LTCHNRLSLASITYSSYIKDIITKHVGGVT
jgi:hypothetical protein